MPAPEEIKTLVNRYKSNRSQYVSSGYKETELRREFLDPLPIRTIDFSNKEDVARHDKMVKLVERMLKLHKDLKDAGTPEKTERTEREIRATDGEIDKLVYELYGLNDNEIRIVEGK